MHSIIDRQTDNITPKADHTATDSG